MHLSLSLSQSVPLLCMAMLLFTYASCDPIKVNSCCEKTSSQRIDTPITSCRFQRASYNCVNAVIFVSEGKHFCSYPGAPWVKDKVIDMYKKGTPCTLTKLK